MKKYPNISERNRSSHIGGKCSICGLSGSDYSVRIQVDIFRGNDVFRRVHKDCIKGKTSDDILKEIGFMKEVKR